MSLKAFSFRDRKYHGASGNNRLGMIKWLRKRFHFDFMVKKWRKKLTMLPLIARYSEYPDGSVR